MVVVINYHKIKMQNINELIGIISGINFDGVINKLEIEKLSWWVQRNKNLAYETNMEHLISLLEQILKDGIITNEEKKMLEENCKIYISQEPNYFAKIYELNGIIEGIICDNELNEKEIQRLQKWMNNYSNIIYRHKPSKTIFKKINQILDDGIITEKEQKELLDLLQNRIASIKLKTKIDYLRNAIKSKKIIGINLIELLDNKNAIDYIHSCAKNELYNALTSYSGTLVLDPEIVFISLVLIGMLYYDGSYYESVRKIYSSLYREFSEQKIEGLIRSILNKYRGVKNKNNSKDRIINVALESAIVPSYYLGSFFEFIFDIYKLNFNYNLPQDLSEEFQFVYDGLHNVMSSESDEIQINVTKKTYKLIKSTKQLIVNPKYNDSIINLSIIIVHLIDKFIWGKNIEIYNPYLKRGYEQWVNTLNKDKEYHYRNKTENIRTRWKPEFILRGNTVYLEPPIHRVKSLFDYRDIRILIRNDDEILYDGEVNDIREIIGGYQIMSSSIELKKPLGMISYQLLAADTIIYDSKDKLYRSYIAFNEQGKELSNNKNYDGTVVFCSKNQIDKSYLYFKSEFYSLSSYTAHLGDAILINNEVFNFSELIHPGVFGEKYDGYTILQNNTIYEIFKNEVVLVFETKYALNQLLIVINQHLYKITDFEFSVAERKGVFKYSVKLKQFASGIYQLQVNLLCRGKQSLIFKTQFAIDKKLAVEQLRDSDDTHIVSIDSDLFIQNYIDEINIHNFHEDWLEFEFNGNKYNLYIPFDFSLYRIDNSSWKPIDEEIWIGNISHDSKIYLYGHNYKNIKLLTENGEIIDEIPQIKNEIKYQSFNAGFLLSYKSNFSFMILSLITDRMIRHDIYCFNKCILDNNKTTVNYDYDKKALVISPYFYGEGNIKLKIVDDQDNIVFTSSTLKKGKKEYIYDLHSFINYQIIFFEKNNGLSLKKERILRNLPFVFYAREDFVGRSFQIRKVYFDQYIKGKFTRRSYQFNTTYIYFKEMLSGNKFIGDIYVRTNYRTFALNNINPVNIEVCSDVIDNSVELSITKDGDGLLLDFTHHGIMNSMDDDNAIDIYSYSMDMRGVICNE